jgi:outer membrane protein assembly factor BamD
LNNVMKPMGSAIERGRERVLTLRPGRGWIALLVAAAVVCAAGCGKRKENRISDRALLSDTAMYRQGQIELARHNLRKAKERFESIQISPENLKEMEPLVRLALADVTFYLGDNLSLIEARSKYLDFVTLYSDHPKAPYAQFQAGVCYYLQAEDPSRDQSQTQVAIGDLRETIRRYPTSRYALAAQDTIDLAERNLAEHEFRVGKFYMSRKAYRAAANRFRRLMDKYPRYRDKEKLYYHLGRALVLGNQGTEGRIYLDLLVADYPDSSFVRDAKKLLVSLKPEEDSQRKG